MLQHEAIPGDLRVWFDEHGLPSALHRAWPGSHEVDPDGRAVFTGASGELPARVRASCRGRAPGFAWHAV
jgi:hypothetical protein